MQSDILFYVNAESLLPVLAAGIAHLILGSAWYHPKVFGSAWMRLTNITPEIAERGGRRKPAYTFIAFLAGLIAAYILNLLSLAWGVFEVAGAMQLALLVWLGFIAPSMLGSFLWDHRPFSLLCINAGYWLVSLIVMALILLV